MNYFDRMRELMDSYRTLHHDRPRIAIIKTVLWSGFFFLRLPWKKRAPIEKGESIEKRHSLQLSSDTLNIGFQINGGLGDFLIAANYIYKFRQKYGYDRIRIDVFLHNSFSAGQAIFRPGMVIDGLYPEEGYADRYRDYDIFSLLNRYCDIKRRNVARIAELAPEILEWIFLCERFRAENDRFFSKRIITDGQSAMLSILEGKKRIQQPDVYGFLGVTEKNEYPLEIYVNEEQCLEEFGLKNRKYIVLHRGCDTRQSRDSVKMWPAAYYNILIMLLKQRYPDIVLVQVGVSHDRCIDMIGTDVNLVEETTLEELKVLLKNAFLLIDGEGGMVHLRHSLSEATSVVFFGPTSVEFFGYSENINIKGEGCATWCEWAVEGWMNKCLRGDEIPPCMASIIPEHVFEKINRYIEEMEGRADE